MAELNNYIVAVGLEKIMFRYIYSEIKHGCSLYISNWKKLLFHPLQAARDITKAVSHPVKTAKALGGEIKKHPIGMAVNIGLNWATGRAIGEGFEYLGSLKENSSVVATQNSSDLPSFSNSLDVSNPVSTNAHILSNNATGPLHSPEVGGLFSTILQIVQYGGGCGCAGVCATATTVGQIGQTASLSIQRKMSHQPVNVQNNLEKKSCSSKGNNHTEPQNKGVSYFGFVPYFNTKRDSSLEPAAKDGPEPAQKICNKSKCKS